MKLSNEKVRQITNSWSPVIKKLIGDKTLNKQKLWTDQDQKAEDYAIRLCEHFNQLGIECTGYNIWQNFDGTHSAEVYILNVGTYLCVECSVKNSNIEDNKYKFFYKLSPGQFGQFFYVFSTKNFMQERWEESSNLKIITSGIKSLLSDSK